MYSKLQYISQGDTKKAQLANIKMALDAGCDWIQLRFKNADEKELYKTGEEIIKLKKTYSFTFILNDFPIIANKINADGVHVGLEDMDVMTARDIIGDKKILGGTANTMQHVMDRIAAGVNYIGLGPYRFTSTKEKLSPVLGLGGYQGILQVLRENKAKVPVYATGGLTLEDLPELMETGVYGIAVSGLITNEPHKKELIHSINTILNV